MSQNVALFRPSTRKLAQVTSGKSHDLDRFPAILAHFRSFPAFGSHVRGAYGSQWYATARVLLLERPDLAIRRVAKPRRTTRDDETQADSLPAR